MFKPALMVVDASLLPNARFKGASLPILHRLTLPQPWLCTHPHHFDLHLKPPSKNLHISKILSSTLSLTRYLILYPTLCSTLLFFFASTLSTWSPRKKQERIRIPPPLGSKGGKKLEIKKLGSRLIFLLLIFISASSHPLLSTSLLLLLSLSFAIFNLQSVHI